MLAPEMRTFRRYRQERDALNRPTTETTPPYVRIAREIRRRITSGQLAPGERVPSARQITQEWGVAIATATKVLSTLGQEGLVRAVPGVGTVVAARESPPASAPVQRHPRRRVVREPEDELTPQRIVRVAIEMADTEGLAGVSMRRIAAELGVATMSLYRHVHSKDDLVLMMADAVLGEVPLPDAPPPGWRAQLELVARLQWAGYGRHPWLPELISMTRPQLLPSGMAHTEWALRALDGLGLEPSTLLHAAVTLMSYVRGAAINFEQQALAEQDTGMTDDEWMAAQEPAFAAIFAAKQYSRSPTSSHHPASIWISTRCSNLACNAYSTATPCSSSRPTVVARIRRATSNWGPRPEASSSGSGDTNTSGVTPIRFSRTSPGPKSV